LLGSFEKANPATGVLFAMLEEDAMRLLLDLPAVNECDARNCAYNVNRVCHARAITIGSGLHPECDTFLAADTHVQDTTSIALVGACKMSACCYNDDLECRAPSIAVAHHERHADCTTFRAA
jgi:hypothetical protein